MAIQVYCNCGNPLIVPAELGGHKVKCKVCETVLKIPELPPGAAPDENEDEKLKQSGRYEVVGEDAVQLSCPSCGALAALEDDACLSCGADLAGAPPGGLKKIPKGVLKAIAGVALFGLLAFGVYKIYEITRPGSLSRDGFRLLDKGDYAGARQAFTDALSFDPHYPRALIGMAEVGVAQSKVGEINRYVPQASKLVDDPRQRAHLLLALARVELDDEKYRDAYNNAVEAKNDDPSQDGIEDVRGLAMLGLEQKDEAYEVLKLAVRQHSENAEVYHQLALLQKAKEEWTDAQASAEEAVKLNPDSAELWYLLSELRVENGNREGGKLALSRVVELDPENSDALSRLSGLHLEDGEYEEALAASKKAQALQPDSMEVALSVGRILLEQGNPKDAAVELERATKLGESWEAQFLLAKALIKNKDVKTAAKHLQKALKMRPDDQVLRLRAARLALEANLTAEATQWAKAVVAADEDNYDARVLLADALASQPNGQRRFSQDIVEQLQAAIKIDPRKGLAPLELGKHYLEQLDPDSAVKAFDSGLAASPSDKELLYWKGRACVRSKAWNKAVDTLEALKRISPNYKDVDAWLRRAEEGRFYNE